MKAATLFVSPSKVDGMPNTVMEAMACGAPLVLSRIAPHTEFVREPEALWFDADDAVGLREALARTLDDPAAARRRVALASASIRRFSVDAMVNAYDAIYQELLGHA
jgi:glycosyltransferase involved in cell wall biosynthesis